MKPDSRMMTNPALFSIAEHFDHFEASNSLEMEEIEVKNKQHSKKQKRLSYNQYPRIKVTLKASEKAQLQAIADSKNIPLATFCRDVMMEYLQVFERC